MDCWGVINKNFFFFFFLLWKVIKTSRATFIQSRVNHFRSVKVIVGKNDDRELLDHLPSDGNLLLKLSFRASLAQLHSPPIPFCYADFFLLVPCSLFSLVRLYRDVCSLARLDGTINYN